MTARLSKLLLLTALLTLASPVTAQEADPPPLRNIATDDIGRLALFYPEGWLLTADESGFSVRDDAAQINVSVQLLEHDPTPIDDLLEVLMGEGVLPEGGAATRETYSGLDSWLIQGEGLFREDTYSAVAAMAVAPDQTYMIRNDFPAGQLADSAATVTAMLDKLVVLPANVTAEGNNLSLHLPLGWSFGSGIDGFVAATNADELRAISRNEVPRQLGVSLRFVNNTTLEDQLNSPTALQQSAATIQVNDDTVRLVLRRDNISDAVEVVMVRQRSPDSFLTMRAVSSDADLLVENLPLVQAIFASVRLQ